MGIMTALATASHVIIVRLKSCLSFLQSRSRNAIAIAGAAPPEHRLCPTSSALRLNSWLATPEFHDETGHVRLRVVANTGIRLMMMIVAKRAGMCAGLCRPVNSPGSYFCCSVSLCAPPTGTTWCECERCRN